MVAERIGSVYETPRLCLPCGREFIPERRPGDRLHGVREHCSDACRRRATRPNMRPDVGPRRHVAPRAATPAPRPEPQTKRPAILNSAPTEAPASPRDTPSLWRLAELWWDTETAPHGPKCPCLPCADYRVHRHMQPLISMLGAERRSA